MKKKICKLNPVYKTTKLIFIFTSIKFSWINFAYYSLNSHTKWYKIFGHDPSQDMIKICQVITIYKI